LFKSTSITHLYEAFKLQSCKKIMLRRSKLFLEQQSKYR
jgi:hypothetical protein